MKQDEQAVAGSGEPAAFDVIVVGAGFAGMYMLHMLRQQGLSVRVYEAGTGVGGTWYWNRYPGARVDIEAREYSYSFSEALEHEWRWTECYAAQPELLRYANHVADRFDLRRDIWFETRVTAMAYDEASNRWTVSTDRAGPVTARYCVMATGCLSVPKDIDIPGIGDFAGDVYLTSRWPKAGVDFTGRKVGVIGTGSSGIQSIPEIARQAARLSVFQRTPNFSLPSHNGPLAQELVDDWLAHREAYRRNQRATGNVILPPPDTSALAVSEDARRAAYDRAWQQGGFAIGQTFNDLLLDRTANETVCAYVREQIGGIVRDPEIAGKLMPANHPFMTKRPCVDTGYYATFNRDNVELIDLNDAPIETVTTTGIRAGGRDHAVDSIVLAIGFDAMTGALCNIDICGRGGVRLKDEWSRDPRAYLGLAIAGYPNMFIITGPGSPSVLSNMMVSIEHHVEWINACIAHLEGAGLDVIEAAPAAQAGWTEHVNMLANATLYPFADSWYVGANIPGKTRAFTIYTGGWQAYREACEKVVANGYEGFMLTATA